MKSATVACLIFVACAVVAWFGASLFCFSGSPNERYGGLFLLVVFGLGAVSLPSVWVLRRREQHQQEG